MQFQRLADLWQYLVVPRKRLRALLVLISAVSIYIRLFSRDLEMPNAFKSTVSDVTHSASSSLSFQSTISAVAHSAASSFTSIQQRSCFIFIVGKLSNPSTGRSFPHPSIPQRCVVCTSRLPRTSHRFPRLTLWREEEPVPTGTRMNLPSSIRAGTTPEVCHLHITNDGIETITSIDPLVAPSTAGHC
jgi:hypothetical protein